MAVTTLQESPYSSRTTTSGNTRLTDDSAKLEWTRREGQKDVAALHYTVAADGSVSLEGRIANDPVQLQFATVDLQSFPLATTAVCKGGAYAETQDRPARSRAAL